MKIQKSLIISTLTALSISLFITGCGTTTTGEPTPAGKNIYVVTSMADLFPSGHEPVLADAMKKAGELCSSQKKSLKVINTYQNTGPYVLGNYPKATVTFSCVKE